MCTDTHIQTRRMHTHSPAESTPVLHVNDITVKFSGEVWAVGEDGGQGGGEERCERENISQITSRFSHPPRPYYLTFHNRALSPSRKASSVIRTSNSSGLSCYFCSPRRVFLLHYYINTSAPRNCFWVCEWILSL